MTTRPTFAAEIERLIREHKTADPVYLALVLREAAEKLTGNVDAPSR